MRVAVPAVLIRESRAVLDRPPSDDVPGLWERAAVLLARQALEETLDSFWRNRSRDLLKRSIPMRVKLLCLGAFMNNDYCTAADVAQLWSTLSNACHFDAHHPTSGAEEIHIWIDRTEELCELLARKAGRSIPRT